MAYQIFIINKGDFKKFITKLDTGSQAKLARDIDLLQENGPILKMPFAKKIHKKLWELRTSGKQKIRIIYSIKKKQIYILHWFIKKSQKIKPKELKIALSRLTSI